MIPRLLENLLKKQLETPKALAIMGPRQVGKTTLVKKLIAETGKKSLYLNADEPLVRTRLLNPSTEQLRSLIGENEILVIDEAQRIENIGITLKLIIDGIEEKKVIITGSSSLDLANRINEPLTGRKFDFSMFPVSWEEWAAEKGQLQAESGLEQRLIYGMYPEVLNNIGNEKRILSNIVGDYLYKDLLSFGNIRKPAILEKLLQAVALQVSSEVSFNELANLLGVNKETVINYLDLLEKAFVLFRLNPLRRNLRQEISTSRKYYFWDNGVRNAILGNFSPLDLRQDTGALWENFLVSERLKHNQYHEKLFVGNYFWRMVQGQEIDFVEETDGKFAAFEFKWGRNRKAKMPFAFLEAYPETPFSVVSPENFWDFVAGKI
jgi:uncharacterized protein